MDGLAADAGTLAIPFALLISDVPYLEMLARQLQEAHGTMSSFRYQVSKTVAAKCQASKQASSEHTLTLTLAHLCSGRPYVSQASTEKV